MGWNYVYFYDNRFPLLAGNEITLKMILIGIPVWTVAGMGFGYLMKYWMGKCTKTETN